ncbi:MAG: alpha/beta hydrolase [Rhodocyclaceae bacterium]|jgi:pimeloyl-ACP methyl ester carboxylesterase|nr:alpha/beta hydrolase [Rhodocyclaceae bacterium]
MPDTTIVFIHGGQHTKGCWDPTVEALRAIRPGAKVLALDLPGHGDEPGDLGTLTIARCVESVVTRIQAAKARQVVLVGHSMAGITMPGVAARLGCGVVRRMIFLACCIPPNGKTVLDTLHQPMRFIARRAARRNPVAPPLPAALASWVFANGMSREQKARVHKALCPESTTVTVEPVFREPLPGIATCWILTLRDRALRPLVQRSFIANLGGVDEVVALDTCHDAMISEPVELARIILERCGG